MQANNIPQRADLIFNVDNARSRDAIRWVHNRIITEYPTYFQGFFLNATRIGNNHHVQIYTEDRQLRILGYQLRLNPFLCNTLYENAQNVVTNRDEAASREIEFINTTGIHVSTITHVFDFPDIAFRTSLGTELMVDEVFQTEIFNDQGPNTIIMTLALDYPPIY